jgi:Na+-driven multidrug efflux pump
MAGELRICAAIYAIALAANLGLNIMLIPAWGLLGAATATAGAMVIEAVLLHAVIRRKLGIVMFIAVGVGRPTRHNRGGTLNHGLQPDHRIDDVGKPGQHADRRIRRR